MALIVQIVDEFGHPAEISSLTDAILDKVLPKGVGFFRTETHVAKDLKAAVDELIREGRISSHPVFRDCPVCGRSVSIWHIYSDGSVYCTDCKPGVE